MKKFFRVLILGLFMLTFTSLGVVPSLAQGDDTAEKTALYEKYTEYYNKDLESRKIALAAAKEFVKKYGSNADDKEIVDYLKAAIPALEDGIKKEIAAKKAEEERQKKLALYNRFDASVKGSKWADTYSVGREILAGEPNKLDVILVLGSIGLDESQKNPPVDAYNDNTIMYAKTAIQKIQGGLASDKFGAYHFTYKTKEYPDGKSNALGWMNYTIGDILYYRIGKKEEALSYLYKATQYKSGTKDNARIYATIGDWYFAKLRKIEDERVALTEKVKADVNTINAMDDGEERDALKKKYDEDVAKAKNMLALENAYADRSIDAYARAYALVRTNPKADQNYKTGILNVLKDLYEFRYQEPAQKTVAKINADVTAIMAKPMPDPATEVKPDVVQPGEKAKEDSEANTGATRTRQVENTAATNPLR